MRTLRSRSLTPVQPFLHVAAVLAASIKLLSRALLLLPVLPVSEVHSLKRVEELIPGQKSTDAAPGSEEGEMKKSIRSEASARPPRRTRKLVPKVDDSD